MIYFLEDDDSIRDIVCYALTAQGLECRGFSLPADFWAAVRKEKPVLALLDIMLPGEDGLSVLKKLKASPDTCGIRVIMLTAKSAEYDKVKGLDMGADGYIAKPFGMMELIARVRAMLRREMPREELSVGELKILLKERRAFSCGSEAELTAKEFLLLELFMEQPNKAFTRGELLNNVWGFDFDGETRTVDAHIKTLRAKLNTCGSMIKTVRGVGYKLEKD